MKDELSGSEAIFGFVGWLTSRKEPVTMSANHSAADVVGLVTRFCEVNDLPEPRDGWAECLVHPGEDGDLIDEEAVA